MRRFFSLHTFLQQGEQLAFLLFLLTIPLQARMTLFAPYPFEEWRAGFLYASDILFFVVLGFWVVSYFLQGFSVAQESIHETTRKRTRNYTKILLGLFIVSVGISLVSGGHAEAHSWYRFTKIGEGVLLFVYAAFRLPYIFSSHVAGPVPLEVGRTLRPLVLTGWAMVAGGVVQSIIGLLQFAQQKSLGLILFDEPSLVLGGQGVAHIWVEGARMIRAYGTMPNPNVLAGFLGVVLFFLFALFLYERYICQLKCRPELELTDVGKGRWGGKWRLALLLVAQFIILGGLFLTFSRGVSLLFFITSFVAFALLYFYKNFEDKKSLRTVLVFYFLFSIFYFLALFPELFPRFTHSGILEEAAVQERYLFNVVALEAIQKSPLFGVGLGNFTSFFRDTLPFMRDQLYQPVHNIFLLIAAESGVAAMFTFIFFFASVTGRAFRRLFSAIKNEGAQVTTCFMLHALCFMLFVSMYDHFFWTIQQTALLFWLVLGILAGSIAQAETK